jgi:Mn2+/Fe2+ NRAMP family transporter
MLAGFPNSTTEDGKRADSARAEGMTSGARKASRPTDRAGRVRTARGTRAPPTRLRDVLRYLGPGMIVAAGLVGSGELIATTKAGAEAGINLLWVIVLGCVVKVFAQIELGRYTVSTSETTLAALNRVPGPRLRANWIIWLWLAMMAATYGLLGGILGGVGQALAMTVPLSGDYARALAAPGGNPAAMAAATDHRTWAGIVAIATALLLYFGRYSLLEKLCIGLVFCFTLITVGNAVALQTTDYAVPLTAIADGMLFGVPERPEAWLTALAAFGVIGMGGTDLVIYPYWCLERGYGRFIGPASPDEAWTRRARGWLRVMKIDAFVSMCVYTSATLAFFFIGATVLHEQGSDPDGMQMVATLASAYVPVFGIYAKFLFLAGALAVLYSSFLVANAGSARLFTDCLVVLGLIGDTAATRRQWVAGFSIWLPLLGLLIFLTGWNPVQLVVVGGLVQCLVLPAVGFSALYLRFRVTDARLRPGRLWDTALLLSCLSLLVIGVFSLIQILGGLQLV